VRSRKKAGCRQEKRCRLDILGLGEKYDGGDRSSAKVGAGDQPPGENIGGNFKNHQVTPKKKNSKTGRTGERDTPAVCTLSKGGLQLILAGLSTGNKKENGLYGRESSLQKGGDGRGRKGKTPKQKHLQSSRGVEDWSLEVAKMAYLGEKYPPPRVEEGEIDEKRRGRDPCIAEKIESFLSRLKKMCPSRAPSTKKNLVGVRERIISLGGAGPVYVSRG